MRRFLRRLLRRFIRWINEPDPRDEPPLTYVLQCRVFRQGVICTIPHQINRAIGFSLVGTAADTGETRLIAAEQAVDPRHWLRLYRTLAPPRQFHWAADGQPAEPFLRDG